MKFSVKLGIGSGVTFMVILLFGWILFPAMLKNMIKKKVALKPGSETREMWTKVPFPVDFKVYIFNVTNSKEMHDNSDSPVVDEVGPFVFDEWKEKVNLVDDEPQDIITYNPKTRFVFNQGKSGKLTMNEIVTIPHPMMTGMLLAVAREKPATLGLVSKAMKEIFNDPQSIFITASVKDILFDGLVVNCSVKGFGAKAVCGNLKTQAEAFDKLGEKDYLFSFFGVKNKTFDPSLTVRRGIRNPRDVGKVIQWKNKDIMENWPTKACNEYQGTDSTIFPAFLKPEEGLWSFAPDLCRALGAYYVKDTTYLGIPVREYNANYGDMSNADEKCYCYTNDTCLKKGVMDLYKCTGMPMYVSLPHFLDSDDSYVEGVRGLSPDQEKHGIKLLFEYMTGTPVSAFKRMQFSLPIQKLPKVSFMANLPDTLMPLMWVEESLSLGPEIIQQIDKQLFRTIRITTGIKWAIAVLSFIGLIVAVVLYFFKKNSITTMNPAMGIKQAMSQITNGNQN